MFKFIDLFSGIGGMRIAFENTGGECVFSSEYNPYPASMYEANFGEYPNGDITKIKASDIPKHDILVAGFPCQPFSIAGVSKRQSLGKKHGFKDEEQGNLFFEIVRILRYHKPSMFLLENVKNLVSHNQGSTFQIIIQNLKKLGYKIDYKVIDASSFVPQHRERVYIVGFLDPSINFQFPDVSNRKEKILKDILLPNHLVDPKYTLSDRLWKSLQEHAQRHAAKGNGFGYGLVGPEDIARTLSARYYKDGSEILVYQGARKNPRRLTPFECSLLMGFPKKFKIVLSDTRAYECFGNSVVVPLVTQIARRMATLLKIDFLKKVSQQDKFGDCSLHQNYLS